MRLVVVLFASLFLLGSCTMASESDSGPSSGGAGAESSSAISAIDNEFDPTELKLTPGEEVTVTFTNEGETVHTFTSEELGFDTGNVDPGETAEVTFAAPDEETAFVCTIHEASDDMVGSITQ